MKKLFLFGFFAVMLLTACEKDEVTIGNASLIEGAWELTTVRYDKTVYADSNGNTHLKDSSYIRTYEKKEQVWLYYENSVSWWTWASYSEQDGQGHWSGYVCDCNKTYVVEGEGENMVIVETTTSHIPPMEPTWHDTRFAVRRLTSKDMVLATIEQMYVSDTQNTVDVQVTYTFSRENTLPAYIEYLRSRYPED